MSKIFFVFILGISLCYGQLFNAERSFYYTQTGNTIGSGKFKIFHDLNFFSRSIKYDTEVQPEDPRKGNYWLTADNLVLAVGIQKHLDLAVGLRLYQSTYQNNSQNVPDDIFVTLRTGSWELAYGHFQLGFLTSTRIPAGKAYNYPFAEYASGAFEYGFITAITYYLDPYFVDRKLSFHYNIGYWNHNEKGKVLYTYPYDYNGHATGEELQATRNSQELRMALALLYPSEWFDFQLELAGILYLRRPDDFVFSAEEWAYLTPSIKFKPSDWFAVDMGLDIRISPADRQWTKADIPDDSEISNLPKNFASWKFHLGFTFNFDFSSEEYTPEEYYQQQTLNEKLKIQEELIKETNRAEETQSEMGNLRKVRRDTEREVKELKKILEED